MVLIRFALGLTKAFVLLSLINIWFNGAAWSQTVQKLGDKPITVRLCPATCAAVNGHGFQPGGNVTVYETRQGWARVSGFLDRAKLVKSFGNSIARKPALWLPVAQLASPPPPVETATKPKASKPEPKARPSATAGRRITVPAFRPGTVFSAATATSEVADPATTDPADKATTETAPQEVAAAETVPQPVSEEPKPVIINSLPTPETTPAEGTSRALTWEELQAKLAEQAAKVKARGTEQSDAVQTTPAAKTDEQAAEALKAQEEADRQAKLTADADAAAKAAAEKAQADNAAAKAEADRLAKEAAAKAEAERASAETAAQAEAEKAAKEAAAKAEAKTAEVKAESEGAAKPSNSVSFTPPKEEAAPTSEPAKTNQEQQVAVVAPPAKPLPEPVYKAAEVDPISFGKRPKTLTKELLDKRLDKLPGPKSKVRKDVIIAMRHYALGLLNSKECTGIAGGGPSAAPGMLFVTCTDDPGYLRQFPLEEPSW